jgi:hypothetical protein
MSTIELLIQTLNKKMINPKNDLDLFLNELENFGIKFIDNEHETGWKVSKKTEFDFDKMQKEFENTFVNFGGYVVSNSFDEDLDPFDLFEWFKKQIKQL